MNTIKNKTSIFTKISDILRTRTAIVIIAFSMLILMAVIINSITVSGDTVEKQKCYKSVMIEANDTLWGIANEYYDCDILSITEYIEELKAINGLSGDTIKSGNYIVISYYAE